jgi:hypothetical protein
VEFRVLINMMAVLPTQPAHNSFADNKTSHELRLHPLEVAESKPVALTVNLTTISIGAFQVGRFETIRG